MMTMSSQTVTYLFAITGDRVEDVGVKVGCYLLAKSPDLPDLPDFPDLNGAGAGVHTLELGVMHASVLSRVELLPTTKNEIIRGRGNYLVS